MDRRVTQREVEERSWVVDRRLEIVDNVPNRILCSLRFIGRSNHSSLPCFLSLLFFSSGPFLFLVLSCVSM